MQCQKKTLVINVKKIFFPSLTSGVSILEISVCMLIGAIIFIMAMTFYNQRLEYKVLLTSAEQITYDINEIKNYIKINGDDDLSFNEKCVAEISESQLRSKILNLESTDTILGQVMNVYVKKSSCDEETVKTRKYEVLLALTSGKNINKSDIGKITKILGYFGGSFDKGSKGFSGWRKSWYINLADWGIVNDHFGMAAYASFFKKSYPYFGKAELYNVELQPFNSGIISHDQPLIITSKEDKVNVIWRGAQIHSVLLNITVVNEEGDNHTIEMNLLSRPYGGGVFITPYNLLPKNAVGNYKILIHVTVSGLNGVIANSIKKSLNIKYE